MSNESKLEGEIRGWNKFFTIFGLRAVNLNEESLGVVLMQPILVGVLICTLNILHFSRTDVELLVFDEDGVVRYVHMFGNYIVVLQKYGASNIPCMIKGYLVFPFLNIAFFFGMDTAEYFFLQPQVNPADVVPVISGHLLILYNILHVLHFSVHLSWLRRLIVFTNVELRKVLPRLRETSRKDVVRVSFKSTTSPRLEESEDEQTLDIMRTIKLCRYLYNEAFELSKDINEIYETRNLITISFNVFVGIIFLAPAVGDIITVLTSKIDPAVTNETITVEHILFHCKWSVTCFFTVYGLIWSCRMTTFEVFRTSSLVYDILALRLDGKVKAELQRFAVQILQSDMEFSAHGFFTLDNKLFLSVLGTFVSYLVVMFQLNV